jgi:acetyl-CoA carboxylase carboxyl transferase subunit beta
MSNTTNLFTCSCCGKECPEGEFEKHLKVCPHCGFHSRLGWQERLQCTADPASFNEIDAGLYSKNPIGFPGYEEKIAGLGRLCETPEAVVTGRCTIMGYPAMLGIMDSRFMMASMGSATGEKITRLFECAAEQGLPAIMFTASGGARMQEGIFSLMQMAKTSGALGRLGRAGQLYLAVMTDPTTGGVTASFASLGDIIIAEPGALIGFAGKRVIQDTIGEKLPEDFQSAEFVHKHGFVDMVVPRKDMRIILARMLKIHGCKKELP